MSRIASVNLAREKGAVKKPVAQAVVDESGLVGDAHAGAGHRQVSLLARESGARFAAQTGIPVVPGAFAENLTTEGLDLAAVGLRDLLRSGDVVLEVTQLGKECHGGACAIFRQTGQCLMPREGVFARVRHGGVLCPGAELIHERRPLKVCVVTLSDRASRGAYADRSGPAVRRLLERHFQATRLPAVFAAHLLPDDAGRLDALLRQAVADGADLIVTTGGTGVGPRDIAPEVVGPLLTRQLPGVMEYIRVKQGAALPAALLSRGVAGLIGETFVFTLPGSERAVAEYLAEITRVINHALLMRMGVDAHPEAHESSPPASIP